MIQSPSIRAAFAAERWLAEKVGITDLFSGVTSADSRGARIRVAILERGLADQRAGQRHGKPMTYREAFQAIYGESLES